MNKIYDIWVGEQFKQFRKLSNLTLEQVGERLGKTKKQIQNYENGVSKIYMDTFFRLCNIYGVDANNFAIESINYLNSIKEHL